MHKSFYASGFLYNLRTQQILLLQSAKTDQAVLWSMLGGESTEGEEAHITFQRVINELLDINLKPKDIYPVYDYFHETLDKVNYVFYAEVKNLALKNANLAWLSFNETIKLLFSAHTKQDLIVGERVINLKWRVDQNIQVVSHQ